MVAAQSSKSAAIRARLGHPVIDSDGHHIELMPVFVDYLTQAGGSSMVERYRRYLAERVGRGTWRSSLPGGNQALNSRDRATSHLPHLLHERMDELGIDFSVIYSTAMLGPVCVAPGILDDELRLVFYRALNTYLADAMRPYADRMTPAAVIPMRTPQEALNEVEYVVNVLGLKAVTIEGYAPRGLGVHERSGTLAFRADMYGLDSDYDYDPVWARSIELKVPLASHAGILGWQGRNTGNFMYDHIGHLGEAHAFLCKALWMGGVTRRFPALRVAFLEGGVAWAVALYADSIARWGKRNAGAMRKLDPIHLDWDLILRLFREHGDTRVQAKFAEIRTAFVPSGPIQDPFIDDWAACEVESAEELRDLFVPNFFFGCEADDPLNAWAFSTRTNPLGARLGAMFGSDISHWDVPDMRDCVEEAHELVDHGLITPEDFRDFVFTNPVRFYAGLNQDFFKGTRCESSVAELLKEMV